MRDLVFTNEAGTVNVTYRVDQVNAAHENFTVMQITGVDPQDMTNNATEKLLALFKKIPHTLTAFKTFATDNSLQLVSKDTQGGDSSTLVEYPES